MRTKKKNNKIVMVDERKKEQKGFSKKKKKARTAQDTIPFDEVYENGLFRMDETFSILFMYDNIDYKVMRDDEKTAFYEKYMHFLNTLPQDVQYQELILNYPTNREMLESAMIPKQETVAPAQSGGSSSGGSGSGGSSSGSGGNSGGGSSGNSSQGGQTTTQVYGGDPVVSYDNNGRYANQGGNAVTGVKLSYNAKTLEVGDTLKLTASVSPANANQSVTWSSSDSSVVSVSNGQLTAKKVGTATVTARANNGVSASCSVTVKSKKQTETVYLSAKEYNIGVGRTITVTLYGASNVTWSVSNSNPVRITPDDNKVKVYAVRNGTTQLYGRDNSTKKVYICEIHVT